VCVRARAHACVHVLVCTCTWRVSGSLVWRLRKFFWKLGRAAAADKVWKLLLSFLHVSSAGALALCCCMHSFALWSIRALLRHPLWAIQCPQCSIHAWCSMLARSLPASGWEGTRGVDREEQRGVLWCRTTSSGCRRCAGFNQGPSVLWQGEVHECHKSGGTNAWVQILTGAAIVGWICSKRAVWVNAARPNPIKMSCDPMLIQHVGCATLRLW